jgi:Sec-independent protein translocase protein TatA
MIKFVLELFVLYIIYKFVFELILPVYKTTKQIKKKMNDMNDQMETQERKNQNFSSSNPEKKSGSGHDYIDYEEIK